MLVRRGACLLASLARSRGIVSLHISCYLSVSPYFSIMRTQQWRSWINQVKQTSDGAQYQIMAFAVLVFSSSSFYQSKDISSPQCVFTIEITVISCSLQLPQLVRDRYFRASLHWPNADGLAFRCVLKFAVHSGSKTMHFQHPRCVVEGEVRSIRVGGKVQRCTASLTASGIKPSRSIELTDTNLQQRLP